MSKAVIQNALQKTFSPEFLNRIDDVIVFNELGTPEIQKIVEIMLGNLRTRLNAMGISINLTDDAKAFLVEKGYDPKYGARPLARAIQKYVEDPLAEFILNEQPVEGSVLELRVNDDKETLRVENAKSLTA